MKKGNEAAGDGEDNEQHQEPVQLKRIHHLEEQMRLLAALATEQAEATQALLVHGNSARAQSETLDADDAPPPPPPSSSPVQARTTRQKPPDAKATASSSAQTTTTAIAMTPRGTQTLLSPGKPKSCSAYTQTLPPAAPKVPPPSPRQLALCRVLAIRECSIIHSRNTSLRKALFKWRKSCWIAGCVEAVRKARRDGEVKAGKMVEVKVKSKVEEERKLWKERLEAEGDKLGVAEGKLRAAEDALKLKQSDLERLAKEKDGVRAMLEKVPGDVERERNLRIAAEGSIRSLEELLRRETGEKSKACIVLEELEKEKNDKVRQLLAARREVEGLRGKVLQGDANGEKVEQLVSEDAAMPRYERVARSGIFIHSHLAQSLAHPISRAFAFVHSERPRKTTG